MRHAPDGVGHRLQLAQPVEAHRLLFGHDEDVVEIPIDGGTQPGQTASASHNLVHRACSPSVCLLPAANSSVPLTSANRVGDTPVPPA